MAYDETRYIQEPEDPSQSQQPLATSYEGTLQPELVLRGRYRIQGVLGVGGMGAVYQARDLNFPEVTKLCAVKEMINLANDPAMRETTIRNFQREANILATLNHPAIPEIFDFFSEGNRAYLVLEFIRGKDLEALMNIADGFLPVEQVRQWAIEICDVLGYLHSRQPEPVVFRDMKPSNVMIDQFKKIRLIDFGIAKTFDVTKGHTMIGTEGYSPPEQYRGEVSPQSDIYALGASLHHVLTRRDPRLEPPFSFENRPISLFNPDVPEAFAEIVNRALAYEPQERFAAIDEMKVALEALGSGGVRPGLSQVISPDGAGISERLSMAAGEVLAVWQFQVEDEIRSTPFVEKGVVYIGAYDNNLWALDAKEGSLVWKYPTEGGIASDPTVEAGYVFVGSEDRILYAVDARSGRVQWTYITNGRIYTSPCVALGHVFFGSDDHNLYAVKAANGRLNWTFEAQSPIRSSPFVSDEMLYFGTETGDFYGLAPDGEMVWRFKARRAISSSPTVNEGLVYFGSNDWNVYALDGENGFTVWRFRAQRPVYSSPAYSNGKIYVGSVDGHLYALDALNGREIWKYKTEDQITSSPLVYMGVVYVGSIDKYLYALNAETGDLLWRFGTEGPIVSSPAADDGLVYIGSTDNRLYALKA